jgi:spore maturation protein CgeB
MSFVQRGVKYIQSQVRLRSFERTIHPATWENHDSILAWATSQAERSAEVRFSESPIVRRGHELRQAVLSEFRNKYHTVKNLRILIHVPSKEVSPGGYSLFSNLIESIEFLGVSCERFGWDESITEKLASFQPTIFLSSDNDAYLHRIDWRAVQRYRASHPLRVGLTASIEAYGNTPTDHRLRWAEAQQINFYYSFRAPEYLQSRQDYRPFYAAGYPIYSVEFGANPLHYFPVGGIPQDLPYVFLASSNPDKQRRYADWLTPIFKSYPGFLDGPGWTKINRCAPKETHRYIYARAKVGINLHIDDSIDWASELNERTYILAACGVPQLVDNPRLLLHRFSPGSIFIANNPKEYEDLFAYLLYDSNGEEATVMKAMDEVYTSHTTFHRAEHFVQQLSGI